MSNPTSNDTFVAVSQIVPSVGMKNYELDMIVSNSTPKEGETYWTTRHINVSDILNVKPMIPGFFIIHCETADYFVQVL